VGLDDREYMREVPIYRRLTGRSDSTQRKDREGVGHDAAGAGEQPPIHRLTSRDHLGRQSRRVRRSRRSWRRAWEVVAVLAVAVGMFFALVYRAEHKRPTASTLPLVSTPTPVVIVNGPSQRTSRRGLIRGTRLLPFGSRLTLSGTTPPMPGSVRILGRWNAGRWQTFAVADANGHPFRFTFPLDHRGTLRIKIVQPDGYTSVGTYTVS
jgi:hypothetical protein